MQYSGQISDGQMHGVGKLVYPNGEEYEGDWVYGKRHGRGKCVHVTSSTLRQRSPSHPPPRPPSRLLLPLPALSRCRVPLCLRCFGSRARHGYCMSIRLSPNILSTACLAGVVDALLPLLACTSALAGAPPRSRTSLSFSFSFSFFSLSLPPSLSHTLFLACFVRAASLTTLCRYVYLDGGSYEGQWLDDRIHGEGTSVYANNNTYTGLWQDGRINGTF